MTGRLFAGQVTENFLAAWVSQGGPGGAKAGTAP